MKTVTVARAYMGDAFRLICAAGLAFGLWSSVPASAEPSAKALDAWHDAITRKPLVKNGCFTAAFPDMTWREVKCVAAPDRPVRKDLSGNIGNLNDFTAQVTSGVISSATGSFDSVSGVLSEADRGTANSFSLQLNTNRFSTPACDKAAVPNACQGWEQFVFESGGSVYIQYWLINYASTCPSGWNTFGSDCWRNGTNSTSTPAQVITNLGKLKLTGKASLNGKDTIIMTTPKGVVNAANQDSVLTLAKAWSAAEFNVFGNNDASQANFNSGVTAVVRTSVNNNTTAAPNCVHTGTTGETVNFNLVGSCSTFGGSLASPAIAFTEGNPPGSIWQFTSSPCKTGVCNGWKKLDNNNQSVRIASTGGTLYQLWNTGAVWRSTGAACSGNSCPGWKMIENAGTTYEIVAGGSNLYQMTNSGQISRYTSTGWQMLDNNTATVNIAAATGGLYALHSTGNIWQYTGTPCSGSVCSGWLQLDNNPLTIAIVTEESNLYQLHKKTGEVWKYTGTPCSIGNCFGWQLLNNDTAALAIAASGGKLYELDTNGEIWLYNGTPCHAGHCSGWQMLNNNPAAMNIVADGSNLYELDNTGNLYRYTGTPCSGAKCSGWQQIDNNASTGRIAASNGKLFQLHVIQTPLTASLDCYECR